MKEMSSRLEKNNWFALFDSSQARILIYWNWSIDKKNYEDGTLSTEEAESSLGQKGLHLDRRSAALPLRVAGILPTPMVSWDGAIVPLVSA